MRSQRGVLVLCLSAAACQGGGGDGTMSFDAEAPLLPGFEKDTGFLPADQPVQVRLVARAGGAVKAHAEATGGDGALEPVAGSGVLDVAASFAFEVHANIDVSGIKYNGLVQSIDYTVPAATTAFDPFLLDGGEAMVASELPAEELASLPLASVPGGTLVLSIQGGTLTTRFTGVCASAADGMAQYTGRVITAGRVELGAMVRFEVPLVGTKEFGPIVIPVDIPELDAAMDLGTLDADGAPMEGTGPCSASDKGDDPDGDGDGGDGDGDGDPDSGNCGLSSGLGDLYSGVGAAATGTTGYASLVKVLDESATPDLLSFSMLDGFGAFVDGLVPGLYQIAGDDAGTSCGLCVYISVDVQGDGSAVNYLLADSGTLSLATIDPTPGTGRVAGLLSNVHLREIAFDDSGNLVEVPDGCATDIDTWSFDVGVTGF
jgi:hypothetical protein